ncbi:23S rRNA (guanosine2251-2'-O)-methyltransferase [Clostridium cavendishii DSM 21758]|uniref:23S rRNA (Guanosine2251-2'-O)-methyltransferase n=1 Tax=Clostridium cavendishii DSM 21758 TaxID=1121302 RepID=A0A1M6V3P8_9CLOT|nr:23S rRNA (guanosine2251-2'-O)-methyltransferase [Clostridium cavendishii DSM 21758]
MTKSSNKYKGYSKIKEEPKGKRSRDFRKVKSEEPRMGRELTNDYRKKREYSEPVEDVNIEVKHSREDLVEGRNAVIELLKTNKTVEQLMVAKGSTEGSINKILGLAKDKRIVVKEVDRKKLDLMSETGAHQGVMAIITPYKYSSVEEILDLAKERNEEPFIIILDELEDPHNLGSIVRTAELCGAHGIIIPKRRNVGVTATVYKASVGAIEYMKIAKVTNINMTIDELKEQGVWVYGTDIEGVEYSYDTDLSGPCAIVVGNEGKGMSKLTKEKCDKLVKIPMIGKINSLNASVAGGIMMYEVMKSRIKK